ncbi:MAG: helix-turn-helix domain-containing protein [Chloroflexaceae bacterium]
MEAIRVSFLTPGEAYQLITNPEPDFPLDYSADAIELIIDLTSGQPNLVQHICHALVSRYNRQRFAAGHAPPPRFTRDDVATVIDAPDFDQGAEVYFSGVWQQAERSAPDGQPALLRALAPHAAGLSPEELAQAAGMPLEATRAALETLQAHDVVTETVGRCHYTVRLMRRWVLRQQIEG